MEFLLTSSYLIRSIAKELEVSPSTISREINNIPRKCIGYKTPKEFYKSYSKCCTSNWNSQGGERFLVDCYSLNPSLLCREVQVLFVMRRFYCPLFH